MEINAKFQKSLEILLKSVASFLDASAKVSVNWARMWAEHRPTIISLCQSEMAGNGQGITHLAKAMGLGQDTRAAHKVLALIVGLSLPEHRTRPVTDGEIILAIDALGKMHDGKVDLNVYRVLYNSYGRDRAWEGNESIKCNDKAIHFKWKAPQTRDGFVTLVHQLRKTVAGAAAEADKVAKQVAAENAALAKWEQQVKEANALGVEAPPKPERASRAPSVPNDTNTLEALYNSAVKKLAFNGTAQPLIIAKIRAMLDMVEVTNKGHHDITPSTPDTITVSA